MSAFAEDEVEGETTQHDDDDDDGDDGGGGDDDVGVLETREASRLGCVTQMQPECRSVVRLLCATLFLEAALHALRHILSNPRSEGVGRLSVRELVMVITAGADDNDDDDDDDKFFLSLNRNVASSHAG